jgi:4-amino-4-deoxy-L-arabinose transferase-like glycosyltransferase
VLDVLRADRRLVLVPAAVALALAGAALVENARRGSEGGSPPALSWILFALAAACLVTAVREPAVLPVAPSTPLAALRSRRLAATVAFGGAFLFAAWSIPLFVRLNDAGDTGSPGTLSNDGSWLLWILSLAAFAAGVWVWQRSAPRPSSAPGPSWPSVLPRRLEVPLLAGLTAAALALRLPDLGSIPHGLWFDEAQNGLVAGDLTRGGATHSVFIGDFTQMGGLYFYVLGGLLSVFGNAIWVLRLLPALAGSAAVLLLYGLASRLYGWRVGLTAAALLAVSSWNITFSRFGMASMTAVALDLTVYLCVVQGLRTGRIAWYAGGGVVLGLDLHGYYIARLVPLVLLLLTAHICLRARTEVRSLRAGAAAFAAGAVLAALPVVVFAIQKPSVYESRVSTVSIFSKTGSAGQPHAVRTSLRAHLLMFNYRGDANGRHNVPGSPMLDWLTAALFFSGLGVCLLRLWRWQYFFPVVWFGAALSGGVLSLVLEAPQAHRTLENSAVTALLAGIFLGGAWEALHGHAGSRRLVAAAAAAATLAAVGGASAMNAEKYFGRQAKDGRVWSDMSVSELDAGLLARRHGNDEIWLTDAYADRPTVPFLAPSVHPRVWLGAYQLPFVERARDVLLLLDPDREGEVSAIAADYPHADFERFQKGSALLLYAAVVPQSDLASSHGALVYRGGRASRAGGTRIGPGAADRLVSTLLVPRFGAYRFAWSSAGRGRAEISIDERRLEPGAFRTLSIGVHRLEIRRLHGPGGPLLWSLRGTRLRPLPAAYLFDPRRIGPSGLTGRYREGRGFDGPAALERVDPVISMYFHTLPIAPPFTVEWRGQIKAPKAGTYVFELRATDTARLFIDGRAVVAREVPGAPQSASVALQAGWHRIGVLYRAYTGYFTVSLLWSPPGRPLSVVPSAFLRPFRPTRPPFGPSPRLDDSDGMLPPGRLVTIDG